MAPLQSCQRYRWHAPACFDTGEPSTENEPLSKHVPSKRCEPRCCRQPVTHPLAIPSSGWLLPNYVCKFALSRTCTMSLTRPHSGARARRGRPHPQKHGHKLSRHSHACACRHTRAPTCRAAKTSASPGAGFRLLPRHELAGRPVHACAHALAI